MKKLLTTILIIILSVINVSSQVNTDKVIDNVTGSKSELYTKTKMFIVDKIDGDIIMDNEIDGAIYANGKFVYSVKASTWNVEHTFTYKVKFYHKDNKVRYVFELITLSESVLAYQNSTGTLMSSLSGGQQYKPMTDKNSSYKRIDVNSDFPGMMKCGFGKNKFYEMSDKVMKTPSQILQEYIEYINTENIQLDDW